MRSKLCVGLLAVGAGCLAQLDTSAANLLLNPSFESPSVPVGNYSNFLAGQVIGSGWIVDTTTTTVAVIDQDYTGGGASWPNPTDGRQFLYLGNSLGYSKIHQDVALAPGSYQLKFDLAEFLQVQWNGSQMYLNLVNTSDNSSLTGGALFFGRPSGSDFSTETVNFSVATPGTYRLVLESVEGYAVDLDNFSLTANNVPDAAGNSSLIVAGLFALALFSRQQSDSKLEPARISDNSSRRRLNRD